MNSLGVGRDLQNLSSGSGSGSSPSPRRIGRISNSQNTSKEQGRYGSNQRDEESDDGPQTLVEFEGLAEADDKTSDTDARQSNDHEDIGRKQTTSLREFLVSEQEQTVAVTTREEEDEINPKTGDYHSAKRKFRSDSKEGRLLAQHSVQKQCVRSNCAYRGRETTLVEVASRESGILHLIATYLDPKDCILLVQTNRALCKAMKGFFLRLDWNPRSLSKSTLNKHFSKTNTNKKRMTSWNLTGAIVHADETNTSVWNSLHIKELKKLFLVCTWDSFDVMPIRDCKKLDCFDAGVCCTSIPNIDKLGQCDNLQYLYIRCCADVKNSMDFLPKTSLLIELSLYMCKNLKKIEGIDKCKHLKVLDLGGCSALISIAPLKGCQKLEQLSLADCSQLQSLSSLTNHSNLNHLDVTGCSMVAELDVLETIHKLNYVSLHRCNSTALIDLVTSKSSSLAVKSTDALAKASLWSAEPVLSRLVALLDTEDVMKRTRAAEILASLSSQDTGPESILLQAGVLDSALVVVRDLPGKAREHALALLARLCHNRRSVEIIGVASVIRVLINVIASEEETQENEEIESCKEHAASAILLIALAQEKRNTIVELGGIDPLVQLLRDGSDGASVEAAGALWNLGATLEIGRQIVVSGAVPVLIEALRTRPLATKVQAAGALRNLAILSENKVRLCECGILTVLIELIKPGKLDVEVEEDLGLLTKVVATLRILSSNSMVQVETAKLGAIPYLCILLMSSNESLRRQTSGALLALSFHESNRSVIAAEKPIGNLIRLVAYDISNAVVMSAAGCLWNLAMNDDLEREIVAQGAIPPLIRRLSSTNIEVVCKAAGALKNLSYQRGHKEIVANSGGIHKLVDLVREGNSRILPYAVGALRLVASGRPETRDQIVEAGAIHLLVQLLSIPDKSNDAVRLASGTLLHLADTHIDAMVEAGVVPHLISTMNTMAAPLLVREEAKYILQRISDAPSNTTELLASENIEVQKRRSKGSIVLQRVRGIPGDTCITSSNRITFLSYSSVGSETFIGTGKCFYEVEIVSVKGFPTFGWVSKEFETGINHLFDCGVGFPGERESAHDSWAIDGVNQRKWPSKTAFGKQWKAGDVLTIAADLETGTLIYGLNGDYSAPMGVAFQNIYANRDKFHLSPALSGSHNTQVILNFGERPFKYAPPSSDYLPVNNFD